MCHLGSPANKRCVILKAGMVATVTKKQTSLPLIEFQPGFQLFLFVFFFVLFLVTAANTNWQKMCHLGSPANKRCVILKAGMVIKWGWEACTTPTSRFRTLCLTCLGLSTNFASCMFVVDLVRRHDKTQVGLNWKYPISELIKLRFTR